MHVKDSTSCPVSTGVATGTRTRAVCGKAWRGRLTLLLLCVQTHVGTAAGSVGSVIKNKVYVRQGPESSSIDFAKQTLLIPCCDVYARARQSFA
jgi:hypothetical protein